LLIPNIEPEKGIGNGSFKDEYISASSVYGSSPLFSPHNARLNTKKGN